jgi:hypothetical protein
MDLQMRRAPTRFLSGKMSPADPCPPEDCNGNTNARCRLGTSVFFIKYVHFAATQKRKLGKRVLSISLVHPARLLMVSLSSGHTHLFIDRCQPLSLCMRLTILALIRAAAACVRGATGKHIHTIVCQIGSDCLQISFVNGEPSD